MNKLTLSALLQSINEDSSVNSLIQSSPVCHKIFDPDFKLQFMSRSGVTALKIENVEEFYGYIFPTDIAPKITRDIFNETMHLASKGETNTVEYSFTVDGNVIWFRTTISPFFNTDGDLIYITADSMDITSTKKAEERNRTLLETTDICLKEIHKNDGPGYTLTFMSPAGQSQLGITTIEEFYGNPYPLDFYPDEAKMALTEGLDRTSRTGETTQVENKLFDSDGNPVWYLSTFTVQRKNADGEVISITGASQNITERVEIQNSLAKAKEETEKVNESLEIRVLNRTEELERANKELSSFASITSHDLKAPIRKIGIFCGIIEEEPQLSVNAKKYLNKIGTTINYAADLIDGIMDYTKLGSDKAPHTVVDLNDAVSNVVERLEIDLLETHGKVKFKDLPSVICNKIQIEQLFENLIQNSFKYRRKDTSPRIEISQNKTREGRVSLTVKDNGVGFDNSYAKKIFDPFQRLDGSLPGKGSGLGLSICKKIMLAHGGDIVAEGELDIGAKFTITFQ
jgi:PAS domain S-box-containing protein